MSDNEQPSTSRPRHLAVVMDGNGRWAKKRFLPRAAGHRAGVNATRQLVENSVRCDIGALTIFAFSSENWNRPEQEVDSLMSLFVTTIASEVSKLHKQNVRVTFIGERQRFSEKLRSGIEEAEKLTACNTGLALNIAANYGGRWDIVQACRKLAEDVKAGAISASDITADSIADAVCLRELPAPDLFIRTGGESRISNFLIWQLAYTELYFTDVLWPDFNDAELEKALTWYASRQRRFGMTSAQVMADKGRQTG